MRARNVKEMIEELKKYPEDTPIVQRTSNSMEMGNSLTLGVFLSSMKMKKEKKTFRDAFDGESYTSEVYVNDDEGTDHIVVR
jgi:hypothetical protein